MLLLLLLIEILSVFVKLEVLGQHKPLPRLQYGHLVNSSKLLLSQ